MKIAFHTLGCKVNQYETEAMKEEFLSRGAEIGGGKMKLLTPMSSILAL